jgi:hypothetical protein
VICFLARSIDVNESRNQVMDIDRDMNVPFQALLLRLARSRISRIKQVTSLTSRFKYSMIEHVIQQNGLSDYHGTLAGSEAHRQTVLRMRDLIILLPAAAIWRIRISGKATMSTFVNRVQRQTGNHILGGSEIKSEMEKCTCRAQRIEQDRSVSDG